MCSPEFCDDNETDPVCPADSSVRCTVCGNVSLVDRLERREGQVFVIRGGKSVQSWYFYCRYCNDDKAKAYDPGSGPRLLGANVELLEVT